MKYLTIRDVDIRHKRVLIRVDFNVPMSDGRVSHDARIQAALPTIEYARQQHAKIILMSHFGRPQEGTFDSNFSLKPVADHLAKLLGVQVKLIADYLNGMSQNEDEVVLLENTRFLVGEKANDPTLSQQLAQLCDVFVMDAFSVCHRKQASTYGVAECAPLRCAGFLLDGEVSALSRALSQPKRPLVAIVGGAKVSTKFQVLDKLLERVDVLVVGGAMANTFIHAQGHAVGNSLVEPDWADKAQALIEKAKRLHKTLYIPEDVCVAQEIDAKAQTAIRPSDGVHTQDMILDIGSKSIEQIKVLLQEAQTIIWNGPVGVFECLPFSKGSVAIAQAVAKSQAFSIAGGGDTLAAISFAECGDGIDYQSTAGGAFLEYLEGRILPGLDILCQTSEVTDTNSA